ncbi:MAG: hypothetical protein ACQKBU_01425, partial [Verrucomicrobiales bacterium]
ILEDTTEASSESTIFDNEPFAEVILLEDVQAFEWQVFDGTTLEWQYDWDLSGRLPLQLELVYAMNPEDIRTPVRQIFWITPKQNPEVMMRQLEQGSSRSSSSSSDDDDDVPDTNPDDS